MLALFRQYIDELGHRRTAVVGNWYGDAAPRDVEQPTRLVWHGGVRCAADGFGAMNLWVAGGEGGELTLRERAVLTAADEPEESEHDDSPWVARAVFVNSE